MKDNSAFFPKNMKPLFIMHFSLCCLGSSGALLLNHNRFLALQNSAGTSQGSLEKQEVLMLTLQEL